MGIPTFFEMLGVSTVDGLCWGRRRNFFIRKGAAA